jgi:hypothetical protein
MAMGLSEIKSLSYLKDNGFEISANHLYRLKRKMPIDIKRWYLLYQNKPLSEQVNSDPQFSHLR